MTRLYLRTIDAVFVYGTLRREHDHPMSAWLNSRAEWLGTGYFQGLLYDAGNYPGAVRTRDETAQVIGDIYRLERPKMILATLDRYEECSIKHPRPHEYIRSIEPVILADGAKLIAWVYLYNRPVDRLKRITSGDYLNRHAELPNVDFRLP